MRTGREDRIFVDMPIGLPEPGNSRPCDTEARKLLGSPRSSSVFPPPSRAVLRAGTYDEARRISLETTGKSLSKQTFALIARIREVDALMRECEKARGIVREVHPEVCFWALNGEVSMQHSKRQENGRRERRDVLERHHASARWIFNEAGAGLSPQGAPARRRSRCPEHSRHRHCGSGHPTDSPRQPHPRQRGATNGDRLLTLRPVLPPGLVVALAACRGTVPAT